MESLKAISGLPLKKIEINWNKNPIPMNLFLSFLTIPTERITDHLGSDNGWTRRENKEYKLIIGGGITGGVNYLDSIQYGIKNQNPYNNYVNPFALFDVMNDEGRKFFIEYYKEDINSIIEKSKAQIEHHKQQIALKTLLIEDLNNFIS